MESIRLKTGVSSAQIRPAARLTGKIIYRNGPLPPPGMAKIPRGKTEMIKQRSLYIDLPSMEMVED